MGNASSASGATLEALEAAAKGSTSGSCASGHPCDAQLDAAVRSLRKHFLQGLCLDQRLRIDEIQPPKPGSSFLVVADFRRTAQQEPVPGSRDQTTCRVAYRTAVRSAAATVVVALTEHHGSVSVLPLLAHADHEVACRDFLASSIDRVVQGSRWQIAPVSLADFGRRRESDNNSILWLPPVMLGSPAPGLVSTVAPHVDVLAFDAAGALYESHEVLSRMPSAVGLVTFGQSAWGELDNLANVVAAPVGTGHRILVAGWVDDLRRPAELQSFVENVGRSESRLDHLCSLFDSVVLVGHPPLSDPSMSEFLSAAERRGVQVIRAPDCAVANATGAVINEPVPSDSEWPRHYSTLGVGTQTVALLKELVGRSVETTGSVNLTVLGTFTSVSPCEGLRDIVLSCGSGSRARESRITIISPSDFMALRGPTKRRATSPVKQPVGTDATDEAGALARLPDDFKAALCRVTIPASRVALWLCGAPPQQLAAFPESAGLRSRT